MLKIWFANLLQKKLPQRGGQLYCAFPSVRIPCRHYQIAHDITRTLTQALVILLSLSLCLSCTHPQKHILSLSVSPYFTYNFPLSFSLFSLFRVISLSLSSTLYLSDSFIRSLSRLSTSLLVSLFLPLSLSLSLSQYVLISIAPPPNSLIYLQ